MPLTHPSPPLPLIRPLCEIGICQRSSGCPSQKFFLDEELFALFVSSCSFQDNITILKVKMTIFPALKKKLGPMFCQSNLAAANWLHKTHTEVLRPRLQILICPELRWCCHLRAAWAAAKGQKDKKGPKRFLFFENESWALLFLSRTWTAEHIDLAVVSCLPLCSVRTRYGRNAFFKAYSSAIKGREACSKETTQFQSFCVRFMSRLRC